jgi:MYXO-CTERM domain-containing protein
MNLGFPLLVAALGAWLLLAAAEAAAATRYVFAVFKGDSAAGEKLSIYTATDGLNFKLLSDTGYGGPTGILRDPTIMKHTDGKYYVAHTTNSWTTTTNNFAIASSTDLLKWTHVVTVPAGVANVQNTWAPEWFKDSDGSVNLIVSIDTTNAAADFRPYKFTAMDGTLTKWSGPTPIGIEPNYIDTFVVKLGSTYHAIAKNETSKFIEHATAPSLTGPWTWVGTGDWAGWGSGKEGPALFQLDGGQWRLFLDCYSGCGYLYINNTSAGGAGDFTSWSKTTTIPGGLSGVVRHGTVLREDDTVVDGGQPDSGGADSGSDAGKADGGPADGGGGAAGFGGAAGGAGGAAGSTAGNGGSAAGRGGSAAGRGGSAAGNGGSVAGAGGVMGRGGAGGVAPAAGTGGSTGGTAGLAGQAGSAAGVAGASGGTTAPPTDPSGGCACAVDDSPPFGGGSLLATLLALAATVAHRRRASGIRSRQRS